MNTRKNQQHHSRPGEATKKAVPENAFSPVKRRGNKKPTLNEEWNCRNNNNEDGTHTVDDAKCILRS